MQWPFVEPRTAAVWLLARDRESRLADGPPRVRDSGSAVRLTISQAATAERARAVLERRGGVLVADRVGEGKTFIALRLIEEEIAGGATRVLVTGPAAIRAQWSAPLRAVARLHGARFGARSAGPAGPAIAWLSHAQLSLGRWPGWLDPCHLVVADESHAFRNPRARRYRSLAWLCRDARVILLSATPINNSLLDLYHQLRLFLGEHALEDVGVPDLGEAFRAAARRVAPVLEPPLGGAIADLVVRRRRRSAPAPTVLPRPERAPPIALRFERSPAAAVAVEQAIRTIRKLDLRSLDARDTPAAATVGLLVRFGLVKRLESSPSAFLASISAMRRFLDAFAEATGQGLSLRPADHRSLAAIGGADQLVLAPLALRPLPAGVDRQALLESARRDSGLLRRLAVLFREPSHGVDPKADALARLLSGPLAGRKVLVFTEFRDTAIALWSALRRSLQVGLVHGGGAWIGPGRAGRRETILRFAPVANGVRPPPEAERIDVLISTDVLAEGFNLQDAADVVSYDLPWNPVRLIQRIGRIDRLGSPHRTIRCYNFVPERGLELMLGLVDRLEAKLDAIRAGIGARERVLGERPLRTRAVAPSHRRPARTSQTIRRLEAGDPDLFEDLEGTVDPGLSPDERIERILGSMDAIGATLPLTAPVVSWLPAREGPAGWLVAVESGAAVRWLLVRISGRGLDVREDRAAAVEAVVTALESDPALAPAGLPGASDAAVVPAIARAALHHLDRVRPATPGRRDLRRRLVRALTRSLAAAPGGPTASLCARADAIAERLRRDMRAGLEIRLERILRDCLSRTGPCPCGILLSRLESALQPAAASVNGPATGGENFHAPLRQPIDGAGDARSGNRSIPRAERHNILGVLQLTIPEPDPAIAAPPTAGAA